jgi:branched-chain amino acid transport system substrate-binding protein
VERDRADVITGVMNSAELLAMRDYVHKQGIVTLVSIAGARQVTAPPQNSPWIFRIGETTDQPNYPFGEWMIKKTKYRTAVVVASDFVAGHQFAGAFASAFKKGGGKIVKEIYIPFGAPDVSSYIVQISQLNPDVVYGFFGAADSIRFVKTYSEYGLKGKIPLVGHNALCEDDLLEAEGDAALGIVSVGHYSPALETPESQAFVKAYEAKHKHWPPRNAENGYSSILLLAAAYDRLKGDTSKRAALQEAIKVAARTIVPPRGKIEFDQYQQVILNEYVLRVERKGNRMTNVVIDTIPRVSQENVWGWWKK